VTSIPLRNICLGVIRLLPVMLLLVAFGAPAMHAADSDQDYDSYKVRFDGFWFYSNPSGTIQGSTETGSIHLKGDFGFNSYSTFAGKVTGSLPEKPTSI
jgi:hypothetical protein